MNRQSRIEGTENYGMEEVIRSRSPSRSHSTTHLKRFCMSEKKHANKGDSWRKDKDKKPRINKLKPSKRKLLEILPNFPVRRGRISIDSMLPCQDIFAEDSTKSLVTNSQVNTFLNLYKENFEMVYPSVGQLVTLLVRKTPLPKPKTSKKSKPSSKGSKPLSVPIDSLILCPQIVTGTLVSINNDIETLSILSCLHGLTLDPQLSPHYSRLTYFVKSESDVSERVFKTLDYVSKIYERSRDFSIEKVSGPDAQKNLKLLESQLKIDFEKIISKRFSYDKIFTCLVEASQEFLEARKSFIEKASKEPIKTKENGDAFHPLLDPEFELQPIPSVDVCFFDLPKNFLNNYAEFLKENKTESDFEFTEDSVNFASSLSRLKDSLSGQLTQSKSLAFLNIDLKDFQPSQLTLAGDKQRENSESNCSVVSVGENELVTILGYQNVKVEPSEAKGLYRKSFNENLKGYLDAEFVNENLSLGFCIVKKTSQTLITFQGNTLDGSSGALLIDKDLKVVGINFGCYYDYQPDLNPQKKAPTKKKKPKQTRSLSKTPSKSPTQSKPSPPPPDDLLSFDHPIFEPGGLTHSSSIKNRNLGIPLTHPLIGEILREREQRRKKEEGFKGFKGREDFRGVGEMYGGGEGERKDVQTRNKIPRLSKKTKPDGHLKVTKIKKPKLN